LQATINLLFPSMLQHGTIKLLYLQYMKNRHLLVLALLLGAIGMQAQLYVTDPNKTIFGIKLGYGEVLTRPETTVVGNEDDFLIYEVSQEDSKSVTSIGMFAFRKFGYLWLEGDLLYNRYQNEYKVRSFFGKDDPTLYYDETFHYIDFQVLSGIHANNFRIGVGPVFHILGDHQGGIELEDVYAPRPRTLSFGFSGNVGYDLQFGEVHVKFDVKFESSFRTIGDHIYYGPIQSKFKGTPDMIIFSTSIGI